MMERIFKSSIKLRGVFVTFSLFYVLSANVAANTVHLVRHFEKQQPTAQGDKDVPLTKMGHRNAQLLAQYALQHAITDIFSTEYKRTKQTANPSANALKLTISHYDPRDLDAFALAVLDKLRQSKQSNILIVGHSNTTPLVYSLLGCESVQLSESDYGDIFTVTFEQQSNIEPNPSQKRVFPSTKCERTRLEHITR